MNNKIKCSMQLVIFIGLISLAFVFNTPNAWAIGVQTYGYFSVNYEDVGETPDGGNDPGEFAYPHLNLMMQSSISDEFRIFLNFAGDDGAGVEVRNYWGEYIIKDYLKFRAGKIYRPFGLFNEKLDAVPTYLGIEPPELFDGDHLMLPRTGTLMVHGNYLLGQNTIKYALMTGNKETIDTGKPVSWDLNYNMGSNTKIGTSGYWSQESGAPDELGSGSPSGGVLPWMAEDNYTVLGAYFQTRYNNLIVKAAFWTANHDATRDVALVTDLFNSGTYLNTAQKERFFVNGADPTGGINTDGSYTINTYYIRFGYNVAGGTVPGISWEMTPFFFWDYYENPETIAKKTWGGDNEAGVADDGKFSKPTIGVVFKPTDAVAFKIDASSHLYKWNGKDESYSEIRFDVSYFFR